MILNKKILLFMFLAVILIGVGGYFMFFKNTDDLSVDDKDEIVRGDAITRDACLGDDEVISYEIKKKEIPLATVDVFIKNKNTNNLINNFQINDIRKNYHPIELHQCGIYIMRMFNYNPQKTEPEAGFKTELWKYNHRGMGQNTFLLNEKDKDGIYKSYFATDFRVDPLEHHIVLLKGYFGSPDYALVIKDLKTLEDVFVLPMTEIEKQNKEIIGNLELDGWTRDGRYFWTATHYGAVSLGFIRVDIQNRTSDIFPAPENVLGGDALNIENGFITVHPGNVWYGVEEIEQEEKAKRRKEGIGTELYIHNLFTGERKFVVKTDEPLYFFKPKWISEDELEYEIPSGEKRIYKIN